MNLVQNAYHYAQIDRVNDLLEQLLPSADNADIRGFEWHYWWRKSHEYSSILDKRSAHWAADISPNGEILAASSGSSVTLWNLASKRKRKLSTIDGEVGTVRSICFSPDSGTMAFSGDNGAVQVWNVGRKISEWEFSGHRNSVNAVSYSHAGDWLASGAADGAVRLWHTSSGELGHTYEDVGGISDVRCLRFFRMTRP